MSEIDKTIDEAMRSDQPMLTKLMEPIRDTRVAPATGIAAIALNMALKFHDMVCSIGNTSWRAATSRIRILTMYLRQRSGWKRFCLVHRSASPVL